MRFYQCLLIGFLTLALAPLYGQSDNPFDLKWREGNSTTLDREPTANDDPTTEPPARAERPPEPDAKVEKAEETPAKAIDTPAIAEERSPAVNEKEPVANRDDRSRGEEKTSPGNPAAERKEAVTRPVKLPTGLIIGLIGLSLLILAVVRQNSKGFINKIYRAAFNENYSALLMREQRFSTAQYLYYITYIVFFISLGVFIFLITQYSRFWSIHADKPLLVAIAFVIGIYLVRHVTMRILSGVFPIGGELRHFNFNIILYNILLGIVLIPVNLLLAFGPDGIKPFLIGLGLTFIGLFYLLRQFRGIVITSHLIPGNAFQFFVYLCTIEILPVLVVLKALHN